VPGVVAAVAAVVPVDGGRDVLGALVRIADAAVDTAQVSSAVAELVPAHMIPTVFALTDRIPFTVGGKIDRRAVTQRLAAAELPAAQRYQPPSTPIEKALATIMGGVLGRPDVGADDDFFSLGGDSLMATAVVAAVRDWLDTPTVMVPDIFATRTVEALACRLIEREPGSDRLERVAELYLEIAEMDDAEVDGALSRAPS
jgi:mycobactin phenyloxazoline synthetase